jgi:hypothetical protein
MEIHQRAMIPCTETEMLKFEERNDNVIYMGSSRVLALLPITKEGDGFLSTKGTPSVFLIHLSLCDQHSCLL